MTIIMPDQHPGRCQNHRRRIVNGYPETVRCLDYEGTPHICTFPPASAAIASSGSYAQTLRQPEPWISPVRPVEET